MTITFDDLQNGNYSFRTYWNDLQQLVGHSPKSDFSALELEALVELGKAINNELNRVKKGSSMGLGDVSFAMVLQDIEAQQDKKIFEQIKEQVEHHNEIVKTCGYSVQYGAGISGKEMYAEMYDEMAHQVEQVQKIISELDPDQRDVWKPYAVVSLQVAQCWRGDDDRLGSWLYQLRAEFAMRQPGYQEPEETSFEEMEWDESEFPDEPDIPDHEWAMMEMEDQMREMQHESRIATIRHNRLKRMSENQSLYEYMDQLAGLTDEVNVKFNQGLQRMLKANLQPGDEIELYFNGRHPGMSLLKRYGESLGGEAKWWVVIEKFVRGNTFRFYRKNKPEKTYLAGISKDERGHFFCPTFFSEWGKIWGDKENEYKPNSADWYKMTEPEIITFHRSLDHWFRNRKKRPEKLISSP